MNKLKEASLKLLIAMLDLAQSIAATIFSGYVLSTLWSWIIVASFNVPDINIPSAIGVMVVAGYVTKQATYANWVEGQSDEARAFTRWMGWAKPAVGLLVGWVIKGWM